MMIMRLIIIYLRFITIIYLRLIIYLKLISIDLILIIMDLGMIMIYLRFNNIDSFKYIRFIIYLF